MARWLKRWEVAHWRRSCHRRYALGGQLAGDLAQCATLPSKQVLERGAEVLHQVPAIGHLLGSGCATRQRLGVDGGSIACDDFDSWVGLKPLGDRRSGVLRKQSNRAVALQIDDDTAVTLSLADGIELSRPVTEPARLQNRA